MSIEVEPPWEREDHAIADIGLVIEEAGDELHGQASVLPTMWVPGTECLRISMLAAWADTLLGIHALHSLAPRIPVTLELDVHLFEDLVGTPTVRLNGRMAKAGSTVLVVSLDFLVDDDRVGFSHAMFVANPDPNLSLPSGRWALDRFQALQGTLRVPFAERVGCVREEPGVAVLPCAAHVRNASNSLNGGLLSVAVEEAALSADPSGRPLRSMQVRYVRPVREGPAVARATVQSGLADVEVRDAGTDALAVLATTRTSTTG